MPLFSKLLVNVDADAPSHPALDRAVGLAERLGARLRLVDAVEDFPFFARPLLPDNLRTLLVRRHEELLQRLADPLIGRGLVQNIEVVCGRPAEELIRQVLQHGHDLLLRSHAVSVGGRKVAKFGPIDLQLLRQCPCPVWLTTTRRDGPVVAAVAPDSEGEGHERLNRRILQLARTVADLDGSQLCILHAWSAFGADLLAHHASPAEVRSYVQSARDAAKAELDTMLADVGLDAHDRLEVRLVKGDPGRVIPNFARSSGASLVVMGSVARTGLAGLLAGNTAERALGALVCSVLTIKPEGFESPVRLEAE